MRGNPGALPKLVFLLTLCGLMSFCSAAESKAAGRFGFAWEEAWSWDQLESHLSANSPPSITALRELREKTPLIQARTLLRHLAELPSTYSLRRLSEFGALDRKTMRVRQARAAIDRAVTEIPPGENIGSMMAAAARLANTRAELNDWFIAEPSGESLPPIKPAKLNNNSSFRVTLDFQPALTLIDSLTKPGTSDDDWTRLAEDPLYRDMVKRHPGALTREQLIDWWRRAANPDPLNRIYEWVFPNSYYDFGGVAVRAESYRKLIDELKARAPALSASVQSRLMPYLPRNCKTNAVVHFTFAADIDAWTTPDNIGLNLEHFGDRISSIERVVSHESYHRVQFENQIPLVPIPVSGAQRILQDELMTIVSKEGSAALMGAAWDREPTDSEVRAGFQLMRDAEAALVEKNDTAAFRKLIREGLELSGPLYKAGWKMARQIEQVMGPGGLAECQSLGAPAFFARYQQALAKPGPSPEGMTLSPVVAEIAVRSAAVVDTPAMRRAMQIVARLPEDIGEIEADRFAAKPAASAAECVARLNVCAGLAKHSMDIDTTLRVLRSAMKFQQAIDPQSARRLARLLFDQGYTDAALEFVLKLAKINPAMPEWQYLAGEAYRVTGKTSQARLAYSRALTLDSTHEPARRALMSLVNPGNVLTGVPVANSSAISGTVIPSFQHR